MDKDSKVVGWLAGIVYFTQGAIGIVGIAFPLYLRKLGWEISEITSFSSIIAFPWILKIIYGFLSDEVPLFKSRRKSYLFLYACIAFVGWGTMAFLPEHKGILFLALIIANIGFAATDVITDGLIVEYSEGSLSHFFQSIAWGSRSLGAVISGVLGGWLAQNWSYNYIFALASVLPLGILFLVLKVHEKPMPSDAVEMTLGKKCFANLCEIKNFFSRSGIWAFIFCFIVLQAGAMYGVPFFFFMKESLNIEEQSLGILMSIGWCGMVLSALIFMTLKERLKMIHFLYLAVAFTAVNCLLTFLVQGFWQAVFVFFLGGVMGGLTLMPLTTCAAMVVHNSGMEGTIYAILMSIYNCGQILFGFLGGKLYPVVGLQWLIVMAFCISLLGFAGIYMMKQSNLIDQRNA